MAKKKGRIMLSLVFADRGSFHTERVSVPGGGLEGYDRLIDFLQEDPEAARHLAVDLDRLVCARLDDE